MVFEAILIASNYTRGSSKGNICVLHTPKSQTCHFHGNDPAHGKQNNNYCTLFATISRNTDCEHQVASFPSSPTRERKIEGKGGSWENL